MEFRPCIDIHDGHVKQIVGGALDEEHSHVKENYVSQSDAAYFAELYKERDLSGGHVIILNNSASPMYEASRTQALSALRAYPGGLHIGGGVNPDNAPEYLDAGASHVIVTSYVFREGEIDFQALDRMLASVGREHLVLDLSVRRRDDRYLIVTDRWQKFTSVELNPDTLDKLSGYCDEFLVHAVDVEGRNSGIESEVVGMLGAWKGNPVIYAGGVHSFDDLYLVEALGCGRVGITIGSALDLFGGNMKFDEVVEYCRKN
ncbi:MAG: phosphoribosylformimino-5-aminoimidazole carboxamide ribotide isomerase [Lachnospiraceae bacterium]|nr:phosphoribosylformimino-5-aminoimidazole carboxamide ribotide isomerase [Lachnospiraceae bacterium]